MIYCRTFVKRITSGIALTVTWCLSGAIFHLMRPDVLPVGDLGLQRAMERLYNAGEPLTKDGMRELAQPWRPWASVATWYLWRSLDPVPVEY